MTVLVPEGVIENLLRRVAALEGQPAPSGESYTPNYLTVDRQGRVGATFTGIVRALGLSLPTPDEVTWTRPDGQIVATIHALDVAAGTQQDLIATAQAVAAADLAFARYGATDSAGAFSGIIAEGVAAGPTSLDQVNVQVNGGVAKTLLDGAGQSEFLQLAAGLQQRTLNWGVTAESWNNSSQTSPTFTIAHGLGVMPVLVIPVSATGWGVSYTWTGSDATNFTVVGWNSIALNQGVSVAWLAIG